MAQQQAKPASLFLWDGWLYRFTGKPADLDQLTARESQVLHYLAQGMSYKLVAAELGISLETVWTHIKRIYEKLHVHSVVEAVAKYRP